MRGGAVQAPQPLTRLVECPQCLGEGFIYWQSGPGYYWSPLGVWLPSEGERICPVCDGDGEVPKSFCPICDQPIDDCMCSEDDYEVYYAALDDNPAAYRQAA